MTGYIRAVGVLIILGWHELKRITNDKTGGTRQFLEDIGFWVAVFFLAALAVAAVVAEVSHQVGKFS